MDDKVKLLQLKHKQEVLKLQIQIAEMENKIQKLEKENSAVVPSFPSSIISPLSKNRKVTADTAPNITSNGGTILFTRLSQNCFKLNLP